MWRPDAARTCRTPAPLRHATPAPLTARDSGSGTAAADKKAWQRDGSPSTWSESIDGKTVKLSAEPSKGRVDPVRKVRNRPCGGLSGPADAAERARRR